MRSLARRGANSLHVQAFAYSFRVFSDPQMILRDLDHWMRDYFVYRGENQEVVRTPEFMLAEFERDGHFEGDCDDVATLYAAFLIALHFVCRFVAIRYDETPDFKHVFVEVWTGQKRVAVDPTVEHGTLYHETERMVLDV